MPLVRATHRADVCSQVDATKLASGKGDKMVRAGTGFKDLMPGRLMDRCVSKNPDSGNALKCLSRQPGSGGEASSMADEEHEHQAMMSRRLDLEEDSKASWGRRRRAVRRRRWGKALKKIFVKVNRSVKKAGKKLKKWGRKVRGKFKKFGKRIKKGFNKALKRVKKRIKSKLKKVRGHIWKFAAKHIIPRATKLIVKIFPQAYRPHIALATKWLFKGNFRKAMIATLPIVYMLVPTKADHLLRSSLDSNSF